LLLESKSETSEWLPGLLEYFSRVHSLMISEWQRTESVQINQPQ